MNRPHLCVAVSYVVSEDKETTPSNLSAKPQGGEAFKQAPMPLRRDSSLGGFNRISISATIKTTNTWWATNGSSWILRY